MNCTDYKIPTMPPEPDTPRWDKEHYLLSIKKTYLLLLKHVLIIQKLFADP